MEPNKNTHTGLTRGDPVTTKRGTPETLASVVDGAWLTQVKSLLLANRTVLGASSAAVCSVVAGFPFDTIKTRMQTYRYPSLLGCVRQTYHEERLRGFFRGMAPPLLTVSLVKTISFSLYENSKQFFLEVPWSPFRSESLLSYSGLCFFSGAVSGGIIALLGCPFELVKVQKQLEQLLAKQNRTAIPIPTPTNSLGPHSTRGSIPGVLTNISVSQQELVASSVARSLGSADMAPRLSSNKSPITTTSWQAAKDLYQLQGIRGLYRGLSSHAIRDSLGTAVYFGTYETAKRLLSTTESPPGPLVHFLSGGLCGVFSWIIIFPVDLVKSVIQKDALQPPERSKYHGFVHCLRDIYRRQGPGALYRGISVTLLRAFPIHSLNFLVYEYVRAHITRFAS
ncbi:hypothetical protein IWQ61_005941 [Dispira simplex]|nr:hypothetical protein IWQ61_005941 [Dispira simplex]